MMRAEEASSWVSKKATLIKYITTISELTISHRTQTFDVPLIYVNVNLLSTIYEVPIMNIMNCGGQWYVKNFIIGMINVRAQHKHHTPS